MTTDRPLESPPWLLRDPLTVCGPPQVEALHAYVDALARLNRRVNLVSRESVDELWTRHVVHSLFLASRRFVEGSVVVDWGTGGGLPLIPLAIAFPDVHFVGVDSVLKKVFAVRSMVRQLGLPNVEVWSGRAEEWAGKADYSVSRATAPLTELWRWHGRVASERADARRPEKAWEHGVVCLKGGDLSEEVDAIKTVFPRVRVDEYPLDSSVYGGQFADKVIVTVTH